MTAPIPERDRPRALCTRFNIVPNDESLFTEALSAAGYRDSTGHKNLAGVGDATLLQNTQVEGRERHMSRGAITDMVKQIAGNENLAARGFELGIDAYILNNPAHRGDIQDRLMATTMEAIIGAVFLDNGKSLSAVQSIIAAFGLGWPE
ncbi:ribonuclease III domain-containing protein [Aspergillus pseudodeflectus]|uniref:Ribonuclease III domain-containing protein n=1 Tax=Aspergillus pseudodeflectus TaxID=176178 RepID=A0ABR4JJC4_9EURO